MDKTYADTVRLLLTTVPDVFASDLFALKGGTAINLFVEDMPRLSVDLDLVYLPWRTPRDEAIREISTELGHIAGRLQAMGLETRKIPLRGSGENKLLIMNQTSQVKIEVNSVFRGAILPVEQRWLSPSTAEQFSIGLQAPCLMVDELYGGKLVAALDRQHPRDLFDVWRMYESRGLTDGAVECFVTCLAGHNRPTVEVLFGNDKDIEAEYHNHFVGMTTEPVSLATLLATRARLKTELPARLDDRQRSFLTGLARAAPDWHLLQCEHAAELPALRWKFDNLQIFSARRPDDFRQQAQALEAHLNRS